MYVKHSMPNIPICLSTHTFCTIWASMLTVLIHNPLHGRTSTELLKRQMTGVGLASLVNGVLYLQGSHFFKDIHILHNRLRWMNRQNGQSSRHKWRHTQYFPIVCIHCTYFVRAAAVHALVKRKKKSVQWWRGVTWWRQWGWKLPLKPVSETCFFFSFWSNICEGQETQSILTQVQFYIDVLAINLYGYNLDFIEGLYFLLDYPFKLWDCSLCESQQSVILEQSIKPTCTLL